jgi:hypothetical protein
MATKTFKIGEYCKGGVITVEIKGKVITVIGKDYDFSTGSNRGSSQKNAKEWTRGTVLATEQDASRQLNMFIGDLTTSWWTGKIIKWIESKVKLDDHYMNW